MGLRPEGTDIERPVSGSQLVAQRRQTGEVDSVRANDEAVGTFLQLETVTGCTPIASNTRAGSVTWRFDVILISMVPFPEVFPTAY